MTVRLLDCPAGLRERAEAIVAGSDLSVVDGTALAELLPAGLRPGRTWPQGDDLVGLAAGGRLVVLGDEVVGGCGAVGVPDVHGCLEIGYGLAPAYQGSGLGTAAVRLLVAALLAEPGVRSLCADVLPANEASWRLLARLGFAREPAGDRGGHRRYVLRGSPGWPIQITRSAPEPGLAAG